MPRKKKGLSLKNVDTTTPSPLPDPTLEAEKIEYMFKTEISTVCWECRTLLCRYDVDHCICENPAFCLVCIPDEWTMSTLRCLECKRPFLRKPKNY